MTPKFCQEIPDIVRVWYHENMRVFHDRLIDNEDRVFFKKTLADCFKNFLVSEE
jgi:dynein heavy chain